MKKKMCSIVISADTTAARELCELNSYRGVHSYSLSYLDKYTNDLIYSEKYLGRLDYNRIFIPEDQFTIIHQQAPTTAAQDKDAIHPSKIGESMLWHNGILKSKTIQNLQITLNNPTKWDTELLHAMLLEYDLGALNGIDGGFACVWLTDFNKIYLFRNLIAPFWTDGKNISSTRFIGSEQIPAEKIYTINYNHDGSYTKKEVATFKTKENPYYFSENY